LDPVSLLLVPRVRDIGDFDVRRALPARERQMVGPFIFFDQMGPVTFDTGQAMDVRPHPHIGISTITWLFEGEIRHQDSLGYDQVIRPGEVNWMTAGRGIVHSERTPQSARNTNAGLAGIQAWMALPVAKEEIEPDFYHYAAHEIPHLNEKGTQLALIAGSAWGLTSPVHTESETFYAELRLAAGQPFMLPRTIEERAIYVYRGNISLSGTTYESGSMIVLNPGMDVDFRAETDCLCMLLGGAAMEGHRHLWWNLVSSRRERIEQAKEDWREGRFARIKGDDEFIPLPEA
jgi:redox-sensitive bicupin YhaK (pirin superfamily)